jgi:hexosaminidase
MKKIIALIILTLSLTALVRAQVKVNTFNAADLKIQWEVLQNNYNSKPQFKSALTITNTGKQPMPATGWKIYFTFPRQVVEETVTGPVKIEHINGDYFRMSPKPNFKGLAINDSLQIPFIANAWALNITDAPEGFYYGEDNKPGSFTTITKVSQVPSTQPRQLQRMATDEIPVVTPEAVYKQNALVTDISESQLPGVFPTPVSFQKSGLPFHLNAHTQVLADALFGKEAAYLKNELALLFKAPALSAVFKPGKIISLNKKAGMAPEAYELQVNADRIVITASTGAGAFYGIQSLKSLLPGKAWLGKMQSITLPGVLVTDEPRFGYRGLMLDVARNFHSKKQVLKVLDLMSLYKLNTLHFHLNDDEGWRIEIPTLPELTEVGAKRGHTEINTDHLQPAYASGPNVNNPYGSGFYTKADFIEILKYANERHITVIPEIESPGHARAAIKSMDARYNKFKGSNMVEAERYLLHDYNDSSVYSSVQHWNDNVIDVSLPSAYNFITTVANDIIKMYQEAGAPLKTIHFGGDEVPAGVWTKSPAAQKVFATSPEVKTTDDLWYYYFKKVNQILKERNLYVSAWEEAALRKVIINGAKKQIPNTDFADQNFHMYVWNNVLGWGAEDLAYRLANAGYPVILSCVTNLYFDLAYQKSYQEPGYYWGGFIDVDKPFKFIPYNYFKNTTQNAMGNEYSAAALAKEEVLTEQGKGNIIGIQGQLWSETARSPVRMEYMLLPKLLGLAERAWAKDPEWATEQDKVKSKLMYDAAWTTFCNVLGKKELPRLNYYAGGFQYRIPTAGVLTKNGSVTANTQFPGMIIRYTEDGSQPTSLSKIYNEPIKSKGKIIFRVFNETGRGGYADSVIN